MNFKETVDRLRTEDSERGYSKADLERERKKLVEERREWTRRFDNYIEELLREDRLSDPVALVSRAAKLADARQSLLNERYPVDWEES